MEVGNILDGKRPIDDKDLEAMIKTIKKPDIVDETLFVSVVRNILSDKLDLIKGVETDPLIKEALRQEELRETDRWASLQIRLTKETRDANFYPASRQEHLPKFYQEPEIALKMANTAKEIEKDLGEIFGLEGPKTSSEEVRLSEAQIEEILAQLNYMLYFKGDRPNIHIDPNVAEHANRRLVKDMKLQLARVKLFPERIPMFTELLVDRFQRSLALPGKWVGNIMAASFGESQTQMTLNTFHASGDKNARKQITGFAKLDSILDASENPQHSAMIIFLNERFTGEQLRLKIPSFQMTTMSVLIETHRVIPSDIRLSPQPRWELVNDAINNINWNIPDGKERDHIHRWNSNFTIPDFQNPMYHRGRILEIKFNVRELFFRKISLAQIANAIEQTSRNLRVVTSSMDIGLIYIFFRFESMATSVAMSGEPPPFTAKDEFGFALENSVYPNISNIQVGGIAGIEYVAVESYKISKAIDFYNSRMDIRDANRRVTISFKDEECLFWAITQKIIVEYMMVKLRRFLPVVGNTDSADLIQTHYDPDTFEFSFNTAPLRWYDYEKNTYKIFTEFKQIEDILTKDTRIPLYELLNYVNLPAVEISSDQGQTPVTIGSVFPTAVRPNFVTTEMTNQLGNPIQTNENNLRQNLKYDEIWSRHAIKRPVRLYEDDENIVLVDFNDFQLKTLGFDLNEIALAMETAFSHEGYLVTSTIPKNQNTIYLKGVVPNPDSNSKSTLSLDVYVEEQLKKIPLSSDIIEQYSLRWFYNVEGKGLASVLAHPDVDPIHTRSDNVVEIYKVLGVEPCRSVLIREIAASTSQNLNPVHRELLADSITHRTPADKPLAQNKHGLDRKGTEFTVRGFEETTKTFMESIGEVNQLESFPSQIMMGLLDNTGIMTKEDYEKVYKDRDIFKFDQVSVSEGTGEIIELQDVTQTRQIVLREIPVLDVRPNEINALDMRRQFKRSAPVPKRTAQQQQRLTTSTPSSIPSSGLL